MLRIAVWHNLPSGGGKRALHQQVRGLLGQGHHVEAWCPPTANQDYMPLGELVSERVVPLTPVSAREKDPKARTIAELAALDAHCGECVAQIETGGFDLLFAHPCLITRAAPIARHTQALPRVLYLQEPHRQFYECFPDLPWRAPVPDASPFLRRRRRARRDRRTVEGYRIQVREEWRSASAFDRILVNSMFSRESIARAYGLPSTVCYLGVDTDHFEPRPVEREGFVMSVGGMAFGKGAERVVRAVGAVPESERPELVWVANFEVPEYRREIEQLAAREGVQLRVLVSVEDDQLIDLLCRCAAMVYAPVLEPFGFAPLEANACGAPVVAFAQGGVRETVEEGLNGRLVIDDDPTALGAALTELLQDPEQARRLGQQARENVVERWGLAAAERRLERELLRVAAISAEPASEPAPLPRG